MTSSELDALINHIRSQASTWLGDEACENIERLIKHTITLQAKLDQMSNLKSSGSMVKHDNK